MYLVYRNLNTIFILACIIILSGCSSSSGVSNKFDIISKFQNKKPAYYHEFCDILIPGELKINKRKTCIFKTSKFSIGVLSLEGKINSEALINFFQKNMSNDNWDVVNSFRSKRSFILFKKKTRWCGICINELKKSISTEIWILPNEEICMPSFLNKDRLQN